MTVSPATGTVCPRNVGEWWSGVRTAWPGTPSAYLVIVMRSLERGAA